MLVILADNTSVSSYS